MNSNISRSTTSMPKKAGKQSETPKGDTKVVVHFPDEVGIELVQANELRHYELFIALSGITSSIAVSFWTAYFTSENSPSLVLSAGAFTIVTLLFIYLGYRFRRKIYHASVIKKVYLSDFK